TTVEMGPAAIQQVIVPVNKPLAQQEGIRRAVRDGGREQHDCAEAVEEPADVLIAPCVAVVGALGVAPLSRVVSHVVDWRHFRLAEFLMRVEAAWPDGALRSQAADVVAPRAIRGVVVVTGAAAVGELGSRAETTGAG